MNAIGITLLFALTGFAVGALITIGGMPMAYLLLAGLGGGVVLSGSASNE
jgi:hypothetical protein